MTETPMDKIVDPFVVVFVGAGEINFGSVEGPWNHSLRLERKLGPRLRVGAIVDLDVPRAERVLEDKRLAGTNTAQRSAYEHTRVFPSLQLAQHHLSELGTPPHFVIIGIPPHVRGTDEPGRDAELQCSRRFPEATLLVEKPVTSEPPEVGHRVARGLSTHQRPVGVGYMLRYLRAVQMMKTIIEENNLVVMGTNARYVMAYEWARKLPWWNKRQSGGPIIEQATHFCDLSRYFGGPVILSSIHANTVEHDEPPGRLSKKNFDEDLIAPEDRIPRMTTASWKYAGGGVGSLTHVVALHGNTYDTELEVYADGYRLKLVDPYSNCPTLYVRRPGSSDDEVQRFPDDDPFMAEISAFVDAADGVEGASERILSSYEDALATYEMTWHIRLAGERSASLYRETQRQL